MKIAYFHTGTILTSWSIFSLASTMRALGHEVLDASIPTGANGVVLRQVRPTQLQQVRAELPTLHDLEGCDVILVAGPEYVATWLNTLYGIDQWCKLPARRGALYLESSQREDCKFRYEAFTGWFHANFFPDPEDARRLRAHHFTWYVDGDMFKPCPEEGVKGHVCNGDCERRRLNGKKYTAAFAGTLYKKRMEFLERFLPLIPEINFQTNGVVVHDVGGEGPQLAAELLVNSLREMKIHVALASNNTTMMVPRPFETMACGTFLITYRTKDNPFRDGEHCRLYDPEKPEELAEMIRYYLAHEDEHEKIARAGCEEVRRNYSWQGRIQNVLDVVAHG
jgi:hypothetical protein